jgi:hypothetical protein
MAGVTAPAILCSGVHVGMQNSRLYFIVFSVALSKQAPVVFELERNVIKIVLFGNRPIAFSSKFIAIGIKLTIHNVILLFYVTSGIK